MVSAVLPLRGRNGLIGFVPDGVVDPHTQQIVIAVEIDFANHERRSALVRTTHRAIQHNLSIQRSGSAVRELRRWMVEQAMESILASEPGLEGIAIERVAMSWVFREPSRREPFLR